MRDILVNSFRAGLRRSSRIEHVDWSRLDLLNHILVIIYLNPLPSLIQRLVLNLVDLRLVVASIDYGFDPFVADLLHYALILLSSFLAGLILLEIRVIRKLVKLVTGEFDFLFLILGWADLRSQILGLFLLFGALLRSLRLFDFKNEGVDEKTDRHHYHYGHQWLLAYHVREDSLLSYFE